jgi:hypothetical protein
MQAAFLLLRQYHFSHLQVRPLQAKKDVTFLQCSVEVSELYGPRARDACLGKEVLLDSLGTNAAGVTFHAHLSKGTLKGCQSILPHGDGIFAAIQLPLPGKDLPLQLDGHHI